MTMWLDSYAETSMSKVEFIKKLDARMAMIRKTGPGGRISTTIDSGMPARTATPRQGNAGVDSTADLYLNH